MLRKIKGGVHPHDEKKSTEDKKIEYLPVPKKLFIPVHQHIGAAFSSAGKDRRPGEKGTAYC